MESEVSNETPADSTERLLTIRVEGDGATIPPPGPVVHPIESNIELIAVPSPGFRFVRWSGDVVSASARIFVFLESDMTVTAEFEPIDESGIPIFFLPWAEGRSAKVTQGNQGSFSHEGRFAWDFSAAIGTPVLAAKAGRVIEVLESSLRNPPGSMEFAQPANYVLIDHGNGLRSLYAHLDFLGAAVFPGQYVAQGQVIGFSGNTGFSTAPHLHFEIVDVHGNSVPSTFHEVGSDFGGVPLEGDTVTSQNQLDVSTVEGYAPSLLPFDAFLVNGVELTGESPPADFLEPEKDYLITGLVRNATKRVCAALVDSESLETVFCELVETAENGGFSISMRIPRELTGRFHFGIISGDEEAVGQAPISVWIMRAPDARLEVEPLIEPPLNASIDFFETRPLIGGTKEVADSTTPYREYAYQWLQASGPMVNIADSAAPVTEFTLPPGIGIEQVVFQLVISDGTSWSLPAEVAFEMPDTFLITRSGVSDFPCQPADACPTFDPPPALVSLSSEVLAAWAEMLGASEGDVVQCEILDPNGNEVRSASAILPDAPEAESFLRFEWLSVGLELLPGTWAATFSRNGQIEAVVEFRVTP